MFNEFWKLYPIKRDKVKALVAFKKLSQVDMVEAILGVKREADYRREMAREGEWVANWSYAQGWITGRRWEDELSLPSKPEPAYDPIADDIENLNLAQKEGSQLFANGKPCTIDGGRFIFDNDTEQASRNVAAYLKSGNQINTGVTI